MKSSRRFHSMSLMLALGLSSTAHAAVQPDAASPRPLDVPALGAAWWQWLEANPGVPDASGTIDCSLGQIGPVWFLAGTNGQPELIGATRQCTIPRNTTLFFPHITVAVSYDDGSVSVPFKRLEAESLLTEVPHGEPGLRACGVLLTYDGVTGASAGIQTVRTQTPTFALYGDPEAIADGHWSTVTPTVGKHRIRIQGSVCDTATQEFLFEIDVSYVIRVL